MPLTKCLIGCCLMLFISIQAEAASAPPIHIEADSVELDEQSGIGTYMGNVKLSQGNLRIDANSIRVFTDKKNLKKIVAEGSPAIFTQTDPTNEKPPIKAFARKIEYRATDKTLALFDQVKLQQGENIFTGDIIHYDIEHNVMKAEGSLKTGRVQATIQVESIQ